MPPNNLAGALGLTGGVIAPVVNRHCFLGYGGVGFITLAGVSVLTGVMVSAFKAN